MSLSGRYAVFSNRESGFGRSDTLLEPQNCPDDGTVFEFKAIEPEKKRNLEETVQAAIQQIIAKKYAAVLESKCGRNRIRIYGFAFKGKEVLIRREYPSEFETAAEQHTIMKGDTV